MRLNFLIVDDSPAMRSCIRRVLEMSGFEFGICLTASDGAQALKSLEHNWVDVILTDINMPGMNGEEFVRRIEAHELWRSIPVVVVSTDATEARVRQMMALGARGYVKKPFHPEEIRCEIERVLLAADAGLPASEAIQEGV
jgi:two-component system chemotaxis response regulator CheY